MSKTCSSYGAQIPNHYRFCTQCGAKVQVLFPNCGGPVSETKYCPDCGFYLKEEYNVPNKSEDILDIYWYLPKESEPATEHTTINAPAASERQQNRSPFDVAGSNGAPAFESKTKNHLQEMVVLAHNRSCDSRNNRRNWEQRWKMMCSSIQFS